MSKREEDFIDAGIAYRMEHGKPMCIAGSNLADVERDFNRVMSFEAGAEYGYQYALQHPQWIPVEEELPKRMNENSRFSDTVLVYNKGGYQDTAYYDYEEKIWRWLPGVTHWMPLPEAPRKEANND